MTFRTLNFYSLCAVAIVCCGCATDGEKRAESFKKLRVGMSAEDVRRIVGKPNSITAVDGVE